MSNENYQAVIIEIDNLFPLDNCDNVQGTKVFGLQAIVGKDVKLGDRMVFFPTECQLSQYFCHYNNLYSDPTKNLDPKIRGYFGDNRRVRAMKFRGHRSECFVTSMDALRWSIAPAYYPSVGTAFDRLGDIEICRKYIPAGKRVSSPGVSMNKKFSKVKIDFPEHFDTGNFFRNQHKIKKEDEVIITAKLHGTSVRIGNVPIPVELPWWKRVVNTLFKREVYPTYYYEQLVGSRRVIKGLGTDSNYYSSDIYTQIADTVCIPKDYMIYGEIIGYTKEGEEIQKGYTYDCVPGEAHLYVYRVTQKLSSGHWCDLPWEHVKAFCILHDLNYVPELCMYWPDTVERAVSNYLDINFSKDLWLSIVFRYEGPSLPNGTVDEGVCIRVDSEYGDPPLILKAKSPKFLQHETKLLDEDKIDMESLEC